MEINAELPNFCVKMGKKSQKQKKKWILGVSEVVVSVLLSVFHFYLVLSTYPLYNKNDKTK